MAKASTLEVYNRINIKLVEAPFIEIYGNKEFSFSQRELLLRSCNKLSFRNRFFLNMIIIDSSGQCYEVIDAKKVKNLYPFWKFEFFDRMIQIELKVQKAPKQISLSDLKSILRSILKNYGSIADADGQLDERLAVIERSETFRDLIVDMMSLEYYGT